MLVKANKRAQALEMIEEAYIDAEESGKQYNKSDSLSYFLELLIDSEKFDRVIEVLKKEINIYKDKGTKLPLEDWGLMIILCLLIS